MAVDLKSNTMFRRLSLLIEPDCLIKLEHERTKDRIRKLMFDRIEQILVWRRIPWGRIILVSLILGGPALLLFLVDSTATSVIAVFLLLVVLGVDAWYLYCRKTTIRIIRAAKVEDIAGIFWPAKVRRLVRTLEANIRTIQSAGRQAD